MAEHNDLGRLGEELAADYLRKEGYDILETNWVFEKAEIDILALRENVLSVVEVKTRSGTDFGLPQEFVNTKKIRLLVRAVNAFVTSRDIDALVRFDIVGVHKVNNGFRITHITDAFYYF